MMTLDEIIYNAICADDSIMEAIGGRVKSTSFELPPDQEDKVSLPNIIVYDGGAQAQLDNKDCEWLPAYDSVQACIEISAKSPKAVKQLVKAVRMAIANYVETLSSDDTLYLDSITTDGTAWDWTRPCYYDTIRYQCQIYNDYEQEDNN